MAYEVTKLVHGRPYRYRVRSERDPESGKFRNRWTYLGRADAIAGSPAVRPRQNARVALLDALARLLERGDPQAVTAAAVSTEAGVAHGTFYRYFRNKHEAIVALLDRVREEHRGGYADVLDAEPADRADARTAVRAWVGAVLRSPERYAALIRVLLLMMTTDEALLAHKRRRREEVVERFAGYLRRLSDRGFASVPDPEGTAFALSAMIEGLFREAMLVAPLDDARIAATADVIERAVFGRLDS